MYATKRILLLLTFLSAFSVSLFSQGHTVCAGIKSVYKADGLTGSTFEYEVPAAGGRLIEKYADSIIVQWGQNKGTYKLGVRETSQYGFCPGDWAYLDVVVVGEKVQFLQPQYSLCGNEGVTIEYNDYDFKKASWVDPTIQNNRITKPGTYELQTTDRNGCLLSSFIKVVQSPQPKVQLGGVDTVICTPEFRLYALNPNTNPQGTNFTWSNGESGTSPFIDISDRKTSDEVKYWVRADLGDCFASDTIVVLACKEAPVAYDIPNTFTPNADGDNDVWEIKVLRDYPNSTVEVFDRWGRKVFTSAKGYPQPWDGRDTKGHYLPMETYYYIIHLNDGIAKKPLLGTITIIR